MKSIAQNDLKQITILITQFDNSNLFQPCTIF